MPPYIKTQSSAQAKIRLISQLINAISRALQKLFRHFSGTPISVFFYHHFLSSQLHIFHI